MAKDVFAWISRVHLRQCRREWYWWWFSCRRLCHRGHGVQQQGVPVYMNVLRYKCEHYMAVFTESRTCYEDVPGHLF